MSVGVDSNVNRKRLSQWVKVATCQVNDGGLVDVKKNNSLEQKIKAD